MSWKRIQSVFAISFVFVAGAGLLEPAMAGDEKEATIRDALSAAPPKIAAGATVMDWEMNVLKQGDNGWTCFPTLPTLEGNAPMCHDAAWMEWADAYINKKELQNPKFGISYMLAGDEGASNIDPYATGPTEDNQWVVEGPHLMILVPDPAMLEGISTDPYHGGPYVMWKGTPYAHIMVPVAAKEEKD
jgi:hypothetical protein